MAKFTISADFDEEIKKFENIGIELPGACRRAVFDAAKIVADNINHEISGITTLGKGSKKGITESERKGLLDGLGVSKIDDKDGRISAAIGFAGYNDDTTDSYPNGKPNLMIARSLDKGTSFREPEHFVSRAVNKSKVAAVQAMNDSIEKNIDKLSR